MMQPADIWKSFELSNSQTLNWDIGAFFLHARRFSNDWILAWERSQENGTDTISIDDSNIPDGLKLSRWALKPSANKLALLPSVPDRPLVVRPSIPLGVGAHSEVQFFIRFPVWAEVSIIDEDQTIKLMSVATETLSNTWFGDNFSGEFCYGNKRYLRRNIEEMDLLSNQVLCPFKIKNASDEMLNVTRICLRVKYLSIFHCNTRLWSNEVTATYRGTGRETQLDYETRPPSFAGHPKLLVEAVEKPEKGFLRNTFSHNPFSWRRES